MTNEEKAIELMGCNCNLQKGGFSLCNTSEFDGVRMCYNKKKLLEMARWKDEQFAKEKEQIIETIAKIVDLRPCVCPKTEDKMLEIGGCDDFCRRDITNAECWKRYFNIKLNKEQIKNKII